MENWSANELAILNEYFESEGVRGVIIRGVKKTSLQIVDKAIAEGKRVTIQNINLTNRDEYREFIRKGYIIPDGWTKEELDILLKYYPIGNLSLCKERGLTKSNYAARKLVSYMSLKDYKEKTWCGVKIIDLIDIYDKYGLSKCYEIFSDLKPESIKLKIEKYRYDVK